MSQVYATEPATSGRVIFETTHGPLEVQLWCRECPATTKLFLQLIVDGYYDDNIFHRIGFCIQTGALRQSPNGLCSVCGSDAAMKAYRSSVQADRALDRRRYEFQSRIRFNHRGQVAMALEISSQENVEEMQPQFFITLEDASHLDGKHIIFGTVSGPTYFNADRIGRTEVDENTNQPVDLENAPRILSVKVVENPIHTDLTPQVQVPWRVADRKTKDKMKKKKKRKGKFDMNVLSFGDEMEAVSTTAVGVKSSHDALQSKSLSKHVDSEVAVAVQELPIEKTQNNEKEKGESIRDAVRKMPADRRSVETEAGPSENADALRDGTKVEGGKTELYKKRGGESANSKQVPSEVTKPKKEPANKDHGKSESAVEARRAKYVKKARLSKKQREEETMSRLFNFQSKVRGGTVEKDKSTDESSIHGSAGVKDDSLAARMARRAQEMKEPSKDDALVGPSYHGQVLESESEEGSGDWMQTRFKCKRHIDHHVREEVQIGGDGRYSEDYKVIDEKKRSRSHRGGDDHRHKRSSHVGDGDPGRSDRDRHRKRHRRH